MPDVPSPPLDFGAAARAALGSSGPPPAEALELLRRLRSALSPSLPPPAAFVGDRVLEARWWWAQSLTTLDEARAFFVYGMWDMWLEGVSRVIDLAGRAVGTCPGEHPDRSAMAASAVDIILDACAIAPQLVGGQLARILDTVKRYCDLLPAVDAAPRRVRALPLSMAAGASAAEALIVLDVAMTSLEGRPMGGTVAGAVRSMARLLAVLGDGARAMALLDDVERGLGLALDEEAGPEVSAAIAEALATVRSGGTPAPLNVDSMTMSEVAAAEAALSTTQVLASEQMWLRLDRAMALLDVGRTSEAAMHFTAIMEDPAPLTPIVRAQAQLLRGIARLDPASEVEVAAADVEAAVASVGEESALGWPLVAYARARISAARGAPDADAAFEFATHLTDGTGIGWRTWAARAAHQADAPGAALESYRRMATEVARERRSTLGYRLDSTSLRDKVTYLSTAVRLAAEQRDWRTALELVETFKARQLQAVLADRRAGIGPAPDRLSQVERRIDALEFAPQGAMDEQAKALELVTLRSERVALLERDDWAHGVSASQSVATSPRVDRMVETATDPDVAILDLHIDMSSGRLTAIGLRAGAGTVGAVDLSANVLAAIQLRAANLQAQAPDSLLYDPIRSPALHLEQLLPGEAIELLDGASDVIISPHGVLHLLPWPAIPLGGARLLEDRAVSLVPSVWTLSLLGPTPGPANGIVCFGAPEGDSMPPLGAIDGAAVELVDLGALYAGSGRTASVISGEDATEERLREVLSMPASAGTALHLACHAMTGSDGFIAGRPFLDGPADPLAAGLVLADGVLDANEVRRMRLQFAEVILSACSTGWRPTTVADVELAADSALGLVSSFIAAGATSVIASLPPVYDDAAPMVLQRYHQQRLAGRSPAAALCKAQAQLLAEGDLDLAAIVGYVAFGR